MTNLNDKSTYKQIQNENNEDGPYSAFFMHQNNLEVLNLLKNPKLMEKMIRLELANRGIDENGEWITFPKAEKLWLK